jgi:hypothetical protein
MHSYTPALLHSYTPTLLHSYAIQVFLYYVAGKWLVSDRRVDMEAGAARGVMFLSDTALTPDQHRETEVWCIPDGTGTFVGNAEIRIRRQAVE